MSRCPICLQKSICLEWCGKSPQECVEIGREEGERRIALLEKVVARQKEALEQYVSESAWRRDYEKCFSWGDIAAAALKDCEELLKESK